MENLQFLTFLSVLTFVIYNVLLFEFSSKILNNSTKNKLFYLVLITINIVLFFMLQSLNLPFYLFYLAVLLVLSIEFKMFSNTSISQVIFGSSVASFHITTIHALFGVVLSKIVGSAPISVFEDPVLNAKFIIQLNILLSLILVIFKKAFPLKILIRISESKKYSILVSLYAFIAIIVYTVQTAVTINEYNYIEQLYIAIFVFVIWMVLFYFNFLYTINFVNMTMYKRQSDEVESIYMQTLNLKNEISEKIKRDVLTGLYNKAYILDVLIKLNEEKLADFGLMFIDINRLKYVNDKFGHKAGDKLVLSVVNSVKSAIRDEDLIARVGGDEIVIILVNKDNFAIDSIEERIQTLVKESEKGSEFPISVCIGSFFVDASTNDKSVREILDEADERMRLKKDIFYAELNQSRGDI